MAESIKVVNELNQLIQTDTGTFPVTESQRISFSTRSKVLIVRAIVQLMLVGTCIHRCSEINLLTAYRLYFLHTTIILQIQIVLAILFEYSNAIEQIAYTE